ncbi:MAG: DEAD/DEAH box helicase [Crocinitomicaceae bacterium]
MSKIKFEQLIENLTLNQISLETEIQSFCFSKVKSGGDTFVLTSQLEDILISVLAGIVEVLQTPADDDAPRILIVAPSKDVCLQIESLWLKISKRTQLIHTLVFEQGDKVKQRIALFNGADIVIGTPKRLNDMYFQNGLNINKLKYFIVYEAEKCVKASSIIHIARMTDSFPKCQKWIIDNIEGKNTLKLVENILDVPFEVNELEN